MGKTVLDCYNRRMTDWPSPSFVRPERDEELRLEAASRSAGGDFAYQGHRDCPVCGHEGQPIHPDNTDRQVCGDCGADLPGPPVTWMIRDDGQRQWFILRSGGYVQAALAPVRSGDSDVDRALAGNVWLNLERTVIGAEAR